jgi:AcrR family transcriptional regulator
MARRPAVEVAARSARARARGTARTLRTPVRTGAQGGVPREQVADIQRSRLLAGAVEAIEHEGFAAATVAHITARARVSRRTFYDLFEDREACVLAVADDVLAALAEELGRAELAELAWRERIRAGLTVVLGFFDREPALARICVVGTLHGGPQLLARREAVLARLARAIDEGREESRRAGDCSPLTAEGLVGAAATIVQARLVRGEREPLLGLAGELSAMIVLPYLGSAAARAEQARPVPTAAPPAPQVRQRHASLSPDPMRSLSMRVTYRTARVLRGILQDPGASNREIADGAGIKDQGQVSKLLARLERLGLIANAGEGYVKGERNAWTLTALGEQVAQRLGIDADGRGGAGAASGVEGPGEGDLAGTSAVPGADRGGEAGSGEAGSSEAGSGRRQTRRSSR